MIDKIASFSGEKTSAISALYLHFSAQQKPTGFPHSNQKVSDIYSEIVKTLFAYELANCYLKSFKFCAISAFIVDSLLTGFYHSVHHLVIVFVNICYGFAN